MPPPFPVHTVRMDEWMDGMMSECMYVDACVDVYLLFACIFLFGDGGGGWGRTGGWRRAQLDRDRHYAIHYICELIFLIVYNVLSAPLDWILLQFISSLLRSTASVLNTTCFCALRWHTFLFIGYRLTLTINQSTLAIVSQSTTWITPLSYIWIFIMNTRFGIVIYRIYIEKGTLQML